MTPLPPAVGRLAESALETIRSALDCFAARDPGPVPALGTQAEEAAIAHHRLCRDMIGDLSGDAGQAARTVQLLLATRSLADIVGIAAEIGGLVYFAANGQRPPVRAIPIEPKGPDHG